MEHSPPFQTIHSHAHYLDIILSSFLGSPSAAYWCFLVVLFVKFGVLLGVFYFLSFLFIALQRQVRLMIVKRTICRSEKMNLKDA